MSSSAKLLVSINSNTGVQCDQAVAEEGVHGWLGCPHKLKGLPTHLAGGTLVRFPYRAVPRNTNLVVTVTGSDARLYLATEASFPGSPSNIDGDLARRAASMSGWLPESCSVSHDDECPKLSMFSTLAQRGVPAALPTIVKQDTIVALIAVPVSCDSFSVAITSNSSASYERMAVVSEGVIAWNNRDHRYVDVPTCLLNGILFQGPYKDVPEGTTLTVRPNARARAYVIVERSCNGHLHETLTARGWQPEEAAPRWHGMPTMAMFGHDCSAGAALTLPPTKGSNAVFSVIVTPAAAATVAPIEVSCVCVPLGTHAELQPLPLAEGTVAWQGEGGQLVNVPGWMLGATLFRGPVAALPAGSVFSVRAAAPSVVYVVVEEQFEGGPGRSGGLLPNALPDGKWEQRHEAPSWTASSKLSVFARRVAAREALSTPEIQRDVLHSKGIVVAVVVKVDIEAFDASVQTSNGLEYGRSKMMETACAWSDCANIWTWVPNYMKDGMLFNGPHDSTPEGTRVKVTATGAFRAYVIVEGAYKGGQARSGGFINSLDKEGWRTEKAPPSWGDMNSSMSVFSKMAPEGQPLRLPPTVGHGCVFCIVIMNIASSTDTLGEELRNTFKMWDTAGNGGILNGDLEVLLTALCPSLDSNERHALLKSLDRSKKGVIKYEDLIEKLLSAEAPNSSP